MLGAEPKCGACGAKDAVTWTSKTLGGGVAGVLVFCEKCGAIYSWVPKPTK